MTTLVGCGRMTWVEKMERQVFPEAFNKLTVKDQLNVFDASVSIVNRTRMRHDDAIYLLAKLGMWLTKNMEV